MSRTARICSNLKNLSTISIEGIFQGEIEKDSLTLTFHKTHQFLIKALERIMAIRLKSMIGLINTKKLITTSLEGKYKKKRFMSLRDKNR